MSNSASKYERAVAAYRDSCDRNNIEFQQPLEEYSDLIDSVIYLRTSSVGYVARYDTRRRRMLV